MKIALVNSLKVCGGGEQWVVRQARAWQERGHETLVICAPRSGLQQLATDHGLPTARVPMRHDLSWPAVMGLGGALSRFRPSAVICCNERAFRLTAPATLLAGRPPLVYRNGLTATFKNKALNRILFRLARHLVVVSSALREEMAAYGWIEPHRLSVIHNGVDTARFRPDAEVRERVRSAAGVTSDRVVAAVIARVTEDKGQLETVQALRRVSAVHPEAELWIVGEGSLTPRVRERAAELGVADRVRFLGFRSDIPDVLQGVDLVIQASHREGMGNSLLEAMSAGKPILASNVGGNPDVVVPGETGELVPPRDADALAQAWLALLDQPAHRRQYGMNARVRAERFFPLALETDNWCRFLEGLTARSAAR